MNFKANKAILKNSGIIGRIFIAINLSGHKKTHFSALKSSRRAVEVEGKNQKPQSANIISSFYLPTSRQTTKAPKSKPHRK